MNASKKPRTRVRRVVIVVPSLVTLANLFLGIWAVILALGGEFSRAGWYIIIAAVLDYLDGRIARMSGSGTRFGAELDSLVDIVSFGVAPAVLIYLVALQEAGAFAWVFSYAFVVCAALRLARYNVQPSTGKPPGFLGLPSPAAGVTLATYYPFSQTAFFQRTLVNLPWQQIVIFLILTLSLLMVSYVRYDRVPRVGVRSLKGLGGLALWLATALFAFWSEESRSVYFFPMCATYAGLGLVRAIFHSVVEREPADPAPVIDATAANDDLEARRPEHKRRHLFRS